MSVTEADIDAWLDRAEVRIAKGLDFGIRRRVGIASSGRGGGANVTWWGRTPKAMDEAPDFPNSHQGYSMPLNPVERAECKAAIMKQEGLL